MTTDSSRTAYPVGPPFTPRQSVGSPRPGGLEAVGVVHPQRLRSAFTIHGAVLVHAFLAAIAQDTASRRLAVIGPRLPPTGCP